MQMDGLAAWGQTDFAPAADYGRASAVTGQEETGNVLQESGGSDAKQEEQQETYEPSEDGLLLYMELLNNSKAEHTNQGQSDELKALRIAHNIMRGLKVPAKDESFLLTKNFKMYMAAKNIAGMKECTGEAKSVLGDDSGTASAGAPQDSAASSVSLSGSAPAASAFTAGSGNGSALMDALSDGQQTDYSILLDGMKQSSYSGGGMSVSRYTKKTGSKRFQYNFKEISAQILSAKTSANARQVLSRARQKTVQIRRKWKYDDQSLQAALVHAEAMERVAKKKLKHLQEEEAAKQTGGPCAGDTDREDRIEQAMQDRQMMMEQQTQGASTDGGLEELLAEAMQTPVLELTDGMMELMEDFTEDFTELMEDTLENVEGLEELTDGLISGGGREMDPADLEEMKRKHRLEEQRAIAEADSKYLRAFFQKLQREQQAAASGAAKVAEAMNSGNGMVSLTSGAAAGGTAAVSAAAASAETAAPVETVDASGGTADPVSADTAVAAIVTEGASIDISL